MTQKQKQKRAPKQFDSRPTKAERQAEIVRRLHEELPPVDIGQFAEVTAPAGSPLTSAAVIAAGELIVQGATIEDAATLSSLDLVELRAEIARGDAWGCACQITIERAYAVQRLRWQGIAELGGKGSTSALWMLDRRGGEAYRAPAQRHEVTRESRELVVNATVDSAIEATATQLGLSADDLRRSGDYWSRAITAQKRGTALPSPEGGDT